MERTGTRCRSLIQCYIDGITCDRCYDSFYGEDLISKKRYVITLKDKNNVIQDYVSPQFDTYNEAMDHISMVEKYYSHSYQMFVEIVSSDTFDLYIGPEFKPSVYGLYEKFMNYADVTEKGDKEK